LIEKVNTAISKSLNGQFEIGKDILSMLFNAGVRKIVIKISATNCVQ